jgi:hypothetical protein
MRDDLDGFRAGILAAMAQLPPDAPSDVMEEAISELERLRQRLTRRMLLEEANE